MRFAICFKPYLNRQKVLEFALKYYMKLKFLCIKLFFSLKYTHFDLGFPIGMQIA